MIAKSSCPFAVIFLLTSLLGLGCTRAAAPTCTAFGDPPAHVFSPIVPVCRLGRRIGPWNDSDGTPRYACIYEPPQSTVKPLPLVVYLHPSLFPADNVEIMTNLLEQRGSANLSDDPARPGFILLAPEGRNTHHYYPPPDSAGPGWDNWYRQFSPDGDVTAGGVRYPENVDAAAIDHFIAAEAATGKIDPNRIFLTGWSNGAAMAYAYGLSRPKIAAIAVYSAPDPYQMNPDGCFQKPVTTPPASNTEVQIFNTQSPAYQVHNACDIAGLCPNALFFAGQLRTLGVDATDTIIDGAQHAVASCDASCGTDPNGDLDNLNAMSRGLLNHGRWPSKWTAAMLDFFRRHPLKQ
ncbi:MAG TPA: PHB depolymerase family esterase [Candidatus Binataceae bacterium]|nr:PHB depolymerase family esterase [Candidatus Binataceae bacterium]